MLAILLITFQILNGTSHSDWSDGPGYPGPWNVPSGGFWEEENIEWYESPGNLLLEAPSQRFCVSDSIYGADASIISSDVNSDGADDIFYGTWNPAGIGWFENIAGGTDWVRHEISNQPASHVDVGDPDGDGDPDLLVASSQDNVLAWFENEEGSWIRHDLSPVASHPLRLVSSDIDADGDEDLLSFSTDNTVCLYENLNGSGTDWDNHVIASLPGVGLRWMEPAELDGDTSPELLLAMHDACDLYYLDLVAAPDNWELDCIAIFGQNWNWNCVDAADIDGDGDQDVVATRTNFIYWFENGNSWERTTIMQDYSNQTDYIRLADLDGNGRPDIITSGIGENPADLWLQTGEPGVEWYKRRGPSGNAGTGSCNTYGDFDADGINEPAAIMSSSVHGTLQWCDLTTSNFPLAGSLTSSIFVVPFGTDYQVVWGSLFWYSYEPQGTSIGFQIRASSDYNDMGEWSDTLSVTTELDSLLPSDGIYVQCRAILSTDNSQSTPILNSFYADGWVPGGIEQNLTPVGHSMISACNPSKSSVTLEITLSETAPTRLSIFDISGRTADEVDLGNLPIGVTVYQSPPLAPGVYFARLTAGNLETGIRLVVVK